MRELNNIMQFDHVVRVWPDDRVTDAMSGAWPPEIIDDDGALSQRPGDDWALLSGFSGQYGYSGPMMHSSEYIGGGMERHILSTPGEYVALCYYDDDDSGQWAVAYREVC
jgi:hypothetical protein